MEKYSFYTIKATVSGISFSFDYNKRNNGIQIVKEAFMNAIDNSAELFENELREVVFDGFFIGKMIIDNSNGYYDGDKLYGQLYDLWCDKRKYDYAEQIFGNMEDVLDDLIRRWQTVDKGFHCLYLDSIGSITFEKEVVII